MPTAQPVHDPGWRRLFAAGGATGALIARTDWSQTPLGPMEDWPQSLRTAVSICLESRFPILLWWGPQLVMLYNDGFKPILGASKHPRAMGTPGREIWPEIWHQIGPRLEGVLAGQGATWSEDQPTYLDRNGFLEECYFTFSYSPIADETGGVGGVFCAVTETTERVVVGRRTEAVRDLAAALVDATEAEEVCRRAARVLAASPDDVPYAELWLSEGDAFRRVATTSGPASLPSIEGTGRWPLEQVSTRHAAQVVTTPADQPDVGRAARAMVLPVTGHGRPAGVLVAGISDRRPYDEGYRSFLEQLADHVGAGIAGARSLEAERRRAEGLAEIDRAKTTFVGNISYELRTPLTLIAGPVEDALADAAQPLPPAQRARMELVRRNAARLHRLVDSLMDVARSEAGQLQPRKVATDLAAVTRGLAATFAPTFARAGLVLRVDCPALPSPVHVDRDMWDKVVLNLLSNALKFTLEGEVHLTLAHAADGVSLTVADTGVGIPPEELPRIFERFHRVPATIGRSIEGSGIGLALVRDLVALHGGRSEAISALGTGSTFRIELPWGEASGPPASHEPAGTAELYVEEALGWSGITPAAGNRAVAPASGARVLIAEDNADLRGYLAGLLGEHYDVELAADGALALESALAHPPDLVVTDVMLPGLDGLALLTALRASPATARVPVIFLSARAGEEAAITGLAAGADDYLVMPFSSAELVARVRATLELARARLTDAPWRSALVRTLREGVFVADADGVVFEVNDAFSDTLGYTPQGVPYRPPYPWCPDPVDYPESTDAFDAMLAPGFTRGTFELPARHAEGAIVWVSVSANTVTDADGNTLIAGTVRDVTQERAVAQRQEAIARFTSRLGAASQIDSVLAVTVRQLETLFPAQVYVADWRPRDDEPDAVQTAAGRVRWSGLPEPVRDGLARSAAGQGMSPGPEVGVDGLGSRVGAGAGHALVVWLTLHERGSVSVEERLLLGLLVDLVGKAARRARRFEAEHEVAATLQQAMLGPVDLPDNVAARYDPAEDGLEVGGDWFDCVNLPGGVIGIVVGDCVGRGLRAAAVMGQLRSAGRALLLARGKPGRMLEGLDAFAASVEGAECSTVFCAVIDSATATLTYSSAGHPPALVYSPGAADGGTWLEEGRGVPLATFAKGRRPEATAELPPGATLVAYTDGLIERRGEHLSTSMERLRAALAVRASLPLDQLVDRLVDDLVPEGTRDDVAVVAYRASSSRTPA